MKFHILKDLILNPSGTEFKAGETADLNPKDRPDDLSDKLLTLLQEQGVIAPVDEPKPAKQKAPAEA